MGSYTYTPGALSNIIIEKNKKTSLRHKFDGENEKIWRSSARSAYDQHRWLRSIVV